MAKTRPVTERDLRMPEFYHLNADDLDDYEFRDDGKIVRKDRWENAILSIRSALGDRRREFEISDVVSAVRAIVKAIEPQGEPCDSCIHMKNAPDAEPCSQCTGYSHYEPVVVHEPENHPKGEG